jgi:DNA-binding transcriptional regulator YdaS (Cro superfamily)
MTNHRLSELLRDRGLKLVDLARKLGIDKGTVTRWGQKGVPVNRVLDVERETGIPRQDLRPDFFGEAAQ